MTNTLTKEDVLNQMTGFGEAFGTGAQSRPNAAKAAVEAANQGVFNEDDAKTVYTAFANGAAAKKGIEFKATSSFDVQASKMGVFLKLGSQPNIDGVLVFDRCEDAIRALSSRAENPLKGSAYDLFCKVARRQNDNPKTELSYDEIESILQEQPAEKDDVAKMIELYKRAATLEGKFAEAGLDTTHLAASLTDMKKQITFMGGEVPPVTEGEKEIAKAEALLKKNNRIVKYIKAVPVAEPVAEGEVERLIAETDEMLQAAE